MNNRFRVGSTLEGGVPDPDPFVGDYAMAGVDAQMNRYTRLPAEASDRIYDDNGNLRFVFDGQSPIEMVYDYRNRMVEYLDVDNNIHERYRYDAIGRRIEVESVMVGHATGARTRFFYDGEQVCEEWTIEPDTDGNKAKLSATYIYGNYIDEVLQMERDVDADGQFAADGSETFYYHTDDQYNVMAVTNAAGKIVERYEYGDYGQALITDADGNPRTASAIGNPYYFTGRRLDVTGLYYFRTRYFDPVAGRFTSIDTIGIWGDPGNGGNGYTYVGDNPWSLLDPFGLCPRDTSGQRGWFDKAVDELYWQMRALRETLRGLSGNGSEGDIAVADGFSKQVWDRTFGTIETVGTAASYAGAGHAGEFVADWARSTYTFDEDVREEARQIAASVLTEVAINGLGMLASGGTSFLARVTVWFVRGYDGYQGVSSLHSSWTNYKAGNYGSAAWDALSGMLSFGGALGTRRPTCFVAGTLVQAESGAIPIEDIQAGDRVWAWNVASGAWSLLPDTLSQGSGLSNSD